MSEYNPPRTFYFEVKHTNFVYPSSIYFDTRRGNHTLETIMVLASVRRQGNLPIGKYVAERNGSDEWAIRPLPQPSSPSR